LSGAVSRRHVYAITHHTCVPERATYDAQHHGGKILLFRRGYAAVFLGGEGGRNKAVVWA